jgi:hypothetical protein
MKTMGKFKAAGALGGSVLAAITSSLCCVGPLVAGALGAGGFAAAARFEKWRPLFLLLTFALLARAWYMTCRKPEAACREGAPCSAGTALLKRGKAALWLATVFVLAAAAFPVFSSVFFRGRGPVCCAAAAAMDGKDGKDGKNQIGVEPLIMKEIR